MAITLKDAERTELYRKAYAELVLQAKNAEERAVWYISTAKAQYAEGTSNYNQLVRLAEHDRTIRDHSLTAAEALAELI